jgi:photosystem II stability/assembly factor-like uncharacterized protein
MKPIGMFMLFFLPVFMSWNGVFADSGGPLLPEQAAYDVTFYDLNLRIDPATRSISGYTGIEGVVLDTLNVFLLHLHDNYIIDSVSWTGIPASQLSCSFERLEGLVYIELPETKLPGERIHVRVDYHGRPKEIIQYWESGFVWGKTADQRDWAGVECEFEGGDIWWPCKDHPSDEPDSVDLHFTVPEDLICLSNGRLKEITENPDQTKTFHWSVSTPINNYCVTFYLAPYEKLTFSYRSVSGDSLPVDVWALPEHYDAALSHSPQFVDHMAFLESICGPYPFRADKYAVAEAPYGNMEHQTIIAYGEGFQNGSCGFDWLHCHELSHEWWGNMVTASDWSDVWIHEGFATYMEALYAERIGGLLKYHEYMDSKKGFDNEHPVAPRKVMTCQSAFSNYRDIYNKAAWVLHTLRYYLGDSRFFSLLKRWAYPDPSLESVTTGEQCRLATTDEFLEIAETVTGEELVWFFEVYLRQPSLPYLICDIQTDTLTLSWKTQNDLPFRLPVDISLGDAVIRMDMSEGMGKVYLPPGKDPVIDPDHWILMAPVFYENREGWISRVSGTTEALFSIFFHDGNVGWIAGGSGTVLKTNNGGERWFPLMVNTSEELMTVFFTDEMTGWVAGSNGIILNTTDGGSAWEEQSSGTAIDLKDILFLDKDRGIVIGQEGVILKTDNGGRTWNPIQINEADDLYSVDFVNDLTGWIAGSNSLILKTTDSGEHWTRVGEGAYTWLLMSIDFIDTQTGWVAGAWGSVYKTVNGGHDWIKQSSKTRQHLVSVHFCDENTGWSVGDKGTILHTSDGGNGWTTQDSGTEYLLYDVLCVGSRSAWAVGESGTILEFRSEVTSVDEREKGKNSLEEIALYPNYPNPFNVSTTFRFYMPEKRSVNLTVYNMLGQQVCVLSDDYRDRGFHTIIWEAGDLPTGVYFFRLKSGLNVKKGKCLLLK